MFDESDFARLTYIAELIADIELIIQRHGDSARALTDVEGKYALLMCLQQVGEALGKIKTAEWQELLEARQANAMRNVIVHNYLGIDGKIICETLDMKIPLLKARVTAILDQNRK